MAKFECELPTELIRELTKLEQNTPKMTEEMLQAGAEVVYKNVKSNMKSSFKDSSELEKYLKITDVYRTKDGSVNKKIAFYGYHDKGKRTFSITKKGKTYSYDGVPVPLIIRAREFGSSSGETKRPFYRKSWNNSQIESAMLKVQKKYIKE